MRPLTSSLTPAEVSELLDIPPELVDALLDSGRVLCHVRRGETRVPLAQLEAFFRDALLRVYQGEGMGPEVAEEAQEHPRVAAPPAGAPPAEEHFEEPEAEEPVAQPAAAAPAAPPPLAQPAAAPELPDLRIASRYVPLRQISGIFADTKFSILQLSATGLRIRHNEPLMPGEEAKLSFALMKPARSVVVRARVVWTSLARMGEEKFSISGLRATEHADRLEQAIDALRAVHELQPERRARSRRSEDTLSVLSGISDEEMALVTAALEKFTNDPIEANRWYSRARFALADENVRRAAPPRPCDREEVLGIWEYLERQVDISKIAGVMSWVRGGDKNAAN
ncbi:MAG TPA: PilZ domain-containing protein [Thermoanaerobaculia bacterium]|nr:PilZ domain-containing protein [Thermoanaerobaculia bacterium]